DQSRRSRTNLRPHSASIRRYGTQIRPLVCYVVGIGDCWCSSALLLQSVAIRLLPDLYVLQNNEPALPRLRNLARDSSVVAWPCRSRFSFQRFDYFITAVGSLGPHPCRTA